MKLQSYDYITLSVLIKRSKDHMFHNMIKKAEPTLPSAYHSMNVLKKDTKEVRSKENLMLGQLKISPINLQQYVILYEKWFFFFPRIFKLSEGSSDFLNN